MSVILYGLFKLFSKVRTKFKNGFLNSLRSLIFGKNINNGLTNSDAS